jgi:hypothetical protein
MRPTVLFPLPESPMRKMFCICRYSITRGHSERKGQCHVFASGKFDIPVVSFVIYLKKDGNVIESPLVRRLRRGRQIYRLDFVVIKLWEVPTQTLRQTGLVGLGWASHCCSEGGWASMATARARHYHTRSVLLVTRLGVAGLSPAMPQLDPHPSLCCPCCR